MLESQDDQQLSDSVAVLDLTFALRASADGCSTKRWSGMTI
jgi:hypothetical protein